MLIEQNKIYQQDIHFYENQLDIMNNYQEEIVKQMLEEMDIIQNVF